MCDTMTTRDGEHGSMLFAKNSDRHPDEVQLIQYVDALEGLDHPTHPEQRKHYEAIQYPRLQEAARSLKNPLSALISRPSWIWGAEMGVNTAGVALGNEAVFAKKGPEKNGLLGMDMLRLTLHNAYTAREAVAITTGLIESFGQGGNGSYEGVLRYHNSFLIADPQEAWIVESAGRSWEVKQIETSASISNAYTLVDFEREHASRIHPLFTKGKRRQQRTAGLLNSQSGSWNLMATILRDNRGTVDSLDNSMASICMDSSGFVKSRTTASMIVEYHEGLPLVWLTGAPLPIYNPFIPFTISEEDIDSAPHADIGFAYRFALERAALTKHLLASPKLAKQEIAALAQQTEQRCRAMVQDSWTQGDRSQLAAATRACLAEEQTYRNQAKEILIAHGADSKSLYEKPDSYYRCG